MKPKESIPPQKPKSQPTNIQKKKRERRKEKKKKFKENRRGDHREDTTEPGF